MLSLKTMNSLIFILRSVCYSVLTAMYQFYGIAFLFYLPPHLVCVIKKNGCQVKSLKVCALKYYTWTTISNDFEFYFCTFPGFVTGLGQRFKTSSSKVPANIVSNPAHRRSKSVKAELMRKDKYSLDDGVLDKKSMITIFLFFFFLVVLYNYVHQFALGIMRCKCYNAEIWSIISQMYVSWKIWWFAIIKGWVFDCTTSVALMTQMS